MDRFFDIKLYLYAIAGAAASEARKAAAREAASRKVKAAATAAVRAEEGRVVAAIFDTATELVDALVIPDVPSYVVNETYITEKLKQKLHAFISQESKGKLFDSYMKLLKDSIVALKTNHNVSLLNEEIDVTESVKSGGSKKHKKSRKRKSRKRKSRKRHR